MKTFFNTLCSPFLLNASNDKTYVDELEFEHHIPKVIHQTFFTKNLPDELEKNVKHIKLQNPDWLHKLYDDADIEQYIKLNFPELLRFYLLINPLYGAARADFFRYLLIYKEGGVYLDIKSGLSKPLNSIIQKNETFISSHWTQYDPSFKLGFYVGINNPNGEIQQWHIITAPGHPILKNVINAVCSNIEKYNSLLHGTGKMGVLKLTGPIVYTKIVTSLAEIYPCRIELSHEEAGLIYNALETYDLHHKVFAKKHYSQLKTSIVKQSILMDTLLHLLNFNKQILATAIAFLNKLKQVRQN